MLEIGLESFLFMSVSDSPSEAFVLATGACAGLESAHAVTHKQQIRAAVQPKLRVKRLPGANTGRFPIKRLVTVPGIDYFLVKRPVSACGGHT